MVSHEVSISFHHCGCPGLVEGLYLFTLYALRLAFLWNTFTSDYLASRLV